MKKTLLGIVLFFALSAVFANSASASWGEDLWGAATDDDCGTFSVENIVEDMFQTPGENDTVFSGPGLEKGAKIVKCKLDQGVSKEKDLKKLIASWSNFLMSLTATLAVVALIWAGFLYITAGGEEGNMEKAKKIIIFVAIGIILILGAYAIVNTVMKARFGESGASLEQSQEQEEPPADSGETP